MVWGGNWETGIGLESKSPKPIAGRAKKSPPNGPETPISRSAFRLGIGLLLFIMAPSVPKGGKGKGMK